MILYDLAALRPVLPPDQHTTRDCCRGAGSVPLQRHGLEFRVNYFFELGVKQLVRERAALPDSRCPYFAHFRLRDSERPDARILPQCVAYKTHCLSCECPLICTDREKCERY